MKNKYWEAAEKIERYGWTQGGYGNEYTGLCMIGATGCLGDIHAQLPELYEVVYPHSISLANDYHFTSETEAIIALSLAACLEDDKWTQ